jgi:hypothetical protein
MRLSIALICAAALAAALPQAAAACPPAVCQYVEQAPSANGHGHGNNPDGSSSVSNQTAQKLNSSAAGRKTAEALGATSSQSDGAKNGDGKSEKGNGKKGNGKKGSQAAAKRRNLPAQASGSSGGGTGGSGGGGGIGIVLPVILGLSLIAALAYAIWRRGGFRNFDLGSVFNRRGDVGG